MATELYTYPMTAGAALTHPTVNSAGSTNGSNDSSSGSAVITANDFLTLLVTEMQNQDPTADTDPNEYINQLVQVNSLEQLVSINQTLTTDLGAPPSSASSNAASSTPEPAASTLPAADSSGAARAGNGLRAMGSPDQLAIQRTAGNLGVPEDSAAAVRVAQALEQPSGTRSATGRLSGVAAAFRNIQQ